MSDSVQSHAPVLVLDADMTPALAVMRSLARYGLTVDVASHVDKHLCQHSRYVGECLRHPNPLLDSEAFRDWVESLLKTDRYSLIFPVTERTLTALLPLLDNPAWQQRIALPSPSSLQMALDKHQTMSLAQQLDIPTPGSWLIQSAADLQQLPDNLSFPLVIKPASSIGDTGDKRQQLSVVYAHSPQELQAQVEHFLLFGQVLVQQYIAGDGVGIELIAKQGEIVQAFQHKRLHEVPLTGGGSSLRESVEINPVLLDAASKLMQHTQWNGVAMVEFKHNPSDNSYALMEINGRFWGSLPLSIAAGADFPVLLYQLMMGQPMTPGIVKTGVVTRKLSADLYWLELVLRRDGDPDMVTFPSMGRIFRDLLLMLLPRHHFDVQQWRDPKPGFVDIQQIIGEQWQRVKGILHDRKQRKQHITAWQQHLNSDTWKNTRQVLFLCYGNINRSALAEKHYQTRFPDSETKVLSAGFHDKENRPADPVMCQIAAESGTDLQGWQSRKVTAEMVQQADLILVMEHGHRERLVADYPQAASRTLLLGMVPGCAHQDEIEDPYSEAESIYRSVFKQVDNSVTQLHQLLGRR